jgi:hypothetical protein
MEREEVKDTKRNCCRWGEKGKKKRREEALYKAKQPTNWIGLPHR